VKNVSLCKLAAKRRHNFKQAVRQRSEHKIALKDWTHARKEN
jgi:hypothetical protein